MQSKALVPLAAAALILAACSDQGQKQTAGTVLGGVAGAEDLDAAKKAAVSFHDGLGG